MDREFVFVAGASSDIGVHLIRRLAAAQVKPLILAHYWSHADRLHELQQEFGESAVVPIKANLASQAELDTLINHIESVYGAPKKIVYLPAMKLSYERFAKLDLTRLKQDLRIQLESAIFLLRRFLPSMSKMPGARIVFVLSSVVRSLPPKYLSAYAVVKYSQLGLVRALGSEYANTHVRVNAVSPSMIETQFLSEVPEQVPRLTASMHPMGRNATPSDVIGAIEFLLSAGADYITGVDLPVTGGSTI
jgi:3-oxoacyl-[acyl-carrier protein] reductase